MIFTVNHTTFYQYSKNVFLEPHTLRLFPRSDPAQSILEHRLKINPEPAGMSKALDLWGNSYAQVWFNDLHHSLKIVSICRVKTQRQNPFDYFLPVNARTIPVQLSPLEKLDLKSCLQTLYPDYVDHLNELQKLSRQFIEDSRESVAEFLLNLNSWIFSEFQREERQAPGIIAPCTLLNSRTGSCRDLSVLFIEICRSAGIPARFVSGYQEGDPDLPQAELHAWAEVYLPAIGWRGYDPTYGLAVADRHIALAASPWPEQTMPVSGNIRGTGATSTMTHEVVMRSFDSN